MTKYESIFIINPTIGEEEIKSTVEKFKTLVEANATLEGIDEWGMRKLAYEVKKLKDGYFTLMNFEADENFPKELERNYKITDQVIKYIIIKKDA